MLLSTASNTINAPSDTHMRISINLSFLLNRSFIISFLVFKRFVLRNAAFICLRQSGVDYLIISQSGSTRLQTFTTSSIMLSKRLSSTSIVSF